ncbi:B12-binding domain-containing radical SAM protein [Methylomonas rapida]|uniref:DUF4080 domain-containing protein n=1 Tax=Methylomonas rapida TaxID=2963939 RepID=A0ABY7GQN4_9GAMM|nr:B12-binding domain-containing radical SAM protein [Methylomonas rapida]WAR46825.1 DUF4080 domain-containing protein [Methylomonas rapida]
MSRIVLCTLNARYIHTAFGLRYLYANMGELQAETMLLEFGIQQRPVDMAEQLLQQQPRIIGLGVYIWNVAEITALVGILKLVAPETVIVLGGPEVSHPPDLPAVADLADFIVTGHGEISFPELCRQILAGQTPTENIIPGKTAALTELASPYPFYSDNDIRQRIVYVEASRGCPFKCEFCLSSLDVTAKPFPLQRFLDDMEQLYQRGARNFKFIDRTFNLKTDTSVAILEFFLSKIPEDLYLHFEVIPDNLPDKLQQAIAKFPPGCLQFEIGVQSFDPEIQQRISRRQDNAKTKANLSWLRQHSHAHIHADLIAGLPGDTLHGFGRSFDELVALKPQEIQVGILKRLRGAPINRHNESYQLRYDPNPPYAIIKSRDMSFDDLQRINRFARFWDLIGNSSRFHNTLPIILAEQPFARFMSLSDALFAIDGSTWKIALKRLFELVYQAMTETLDVPQDTASRALALDYSLNGEKGLPDFLRDKPRQTKRLKANQRQRQAQPLN